jgi:hypothetical protein
MANHRLLNNSHWMLMLAIQKLYLKEAKLF